MRALFIIAWLFIGLAAAIYHYGPGQKKLEMDQVDSMLDQARTNVSLKDYSAAIDQFDAIMTELPAAKRNLSDCSLKKPKLKCTTPSYPKLAMASSHC